MVVYNFKLNHFLFPQLFIFFYIFTITSFFSVLTPFTFTSALSFNFTGLVVSSFNSSISNLTNFTTHFSFVIDSENQTEYADGMTFFLTPWGSTIPMPTEGRDLGLTRIDQPLNSTNNPFFFCSGVRYLYNLAFNPRNAWDHFMNQETINLIYYT
ncbi:hypothetical protein CFP56_029115 [Quercus suber]|uniref:Legume lectin domain-containing protein n=1 Tax=Quercus suber TaxID=58331 RepID=A0AAW0MEE7_QUESU